MKINRRIAPTRTRLAERRRNTIPVSLLMILFLWGTAPQAHGQFTLAQDDAGNYGGSWNDGDNEGFGFGPWEFNHTPGTGSAGVFIGDPRSAGISGMSEETFGFFANPIGSVANAEVARFFSQPLEIGQTFSFQWGLNWDSDDENSNRGFNLRSGGVEIININMANSATITINGSPMFNNYGTQGFTLNFELVDENSLRIFGTGRDGSEAYDNTFLLADLPVSEFEIDEFRFYFNATEAGVDQRQMYVNNLQITSGSVAAALHGQEGFRMLSAPTTAAYSALLDPLWTQGGTGSNAPNAPSNVWRWDNSTTGNQNTDWSPLANFNDQIDPGTGFLVYVFDKETPGGEDVAFPVSLSVSGLENQQGTEGIQPPMNQNENGWSLLGNPFAVPVSFGELGKENVFEIVYVWNPSTDAYDSWTVAEPEAGNLTGGIIAPFQGFFVETESDDPSVTFTDGAKTSGGDGFLGKSTPSSLVRLEMQGEGLRNSTWLSFREDGSMHRHPGDAHQLMPLSGNYVILASQKTDGLFDISLLPIPDENFELPLVTQSTKGGTFTLSVTDWNVSFGQPLYLVDRERNEAVELREGASYEFVLDQPLEKTVSSPFELINQGPKKAVADDGPRFVITASGPVSSETPSETPDRLELAQNYPNPFNPSTRISYSVPEQTDVRLAVYDMLGRQIAVLVDEAKSPGRYDVSWDASTLSSGVYIYRIEAGGQTLTRSMTLVK